MELNEQLIQAVTKAVVEQLKKNNAQLPAGINAGSSSPAETSSLAGRENAPEALL